MFFKLLLDLPKTILFNFYYCPLKDAVKLPFHVDFRTKIKKLGRRNSVVLKNKNKRIRIGFPGSFALGGRTYWSISSSGTIIFDGSAVFSKGTQIICDGRLTVGDGFFCNTDCIINCGNDIQIGCECLLGWNCTIIDGDGHNVIYDKNKKSRYGKIMIGDHVWCASNSSVLKNSLIQDNSVLAYGGLISKEFSEQNLLVGGYNKILRKGVSWEK